MMFGFRIYIAILPIVGRKLYPFHQPFL